VKKVSHPCLFFFLRVKPSIKFHVKRLTLVILFEHEEKATEPTEALTEPTLVSKLKLINVKIFLGHFYSTVGAIIL